MKKILLMVSIILLLSIIVVFAHEHNFAEAKQLIDSGVSCNNLNDEQLEAIGDYYMEQMHPGEAHEMMDKMMGGEGSESLRQMHITMARRIYCNENVDEMMASGGMMGMMNMMGGGMMSSQISQTNMMQGMTRNFGYYGYWNFLNVLYIILLIGLIILIYLWIVKLGKNMRNKNSKK